MAHIRKTVTEEPLPLFEWEAFDRQGRRLILEICSSPVTIGGKVRLLASIRDVTSRKQMEKDLELLRIKDPLTSAYNRDYFEADMAKAKADGREVGIIACDIDGLKLINDTLGFEQGDELLKKVAGILQAGVRAAGYVAAIGGGEFTVVIYEPTKDVMEELDKYYLGAVAAHNRDNPHLPLSLSLGWETGANINEVIKTAEKNMYREKMLRRHSARGSFVQTMMKALEEKDHITEGHADRLGDLMAAMGQRLRLSHGEIAELLLLAKFHDIGKVGIPDSILKKPGRLTEEEMAVMRKHTEIGCRIAMASVDLEPIADFILKHHEQWNGQGYPLGLLGENIPVQCRILGIVDTFDAMTNDRPYRKAQPSSMALAELQRCAGTQFDPELVKVFVSEISDTPLEQALPTEPSKG